MAGFVAQLDEINALADASPGFVWRLQDEAGDATSIRAFDDPRMLVNLSLWESVEALREFVYKTAHKGVMLDRKRWFESMDGPHMVLWWIPAGELPGVDQAKRKLATLATNGPTAQAFTFAKPFPAPGSNG